jgi:hypothetical protein
MEALSFIMSHLYFGKPMKHVIGRLLFVGHLEGQRGYGALRKPSVYDLENAETQCCKLQKHKGCVNEQNQHLHMYQVQ